MRENCISDCVKHRLKKDSEITRNHSSTINTAQLSKYVWKLKEKNVTPSIKWRVIKAVHTNAKSKFCKLSLMEKFYLINSLDNVKVLNLQNLLVNVDIRIS